MSTNQVIRTSNFEQENRSAAIELAQQGIRVIPCELVEHVKDDGSKTFTKKPCIKDWQAKASSDFLQVNRWWGQFPHAFPGIPMGDGRLVLDLDQKDSKQGVQSFQRICQDANIDQSGFVSVSTPSGGVHIYFATDEQFSNQVNVSGLGIDVRSSGGWVAAPNAVLPGGKRYELLSGSLIALPQLPEALKPFLRPKDVSETPALPTTSQERPEPTEREIQYAQVALRDEVERLSAMREGQGRNAALNTAALHLGEFVASGAIERSTVEQSLLAASEANGYIAKDGKGAAWATLRSGLETGMKKPRAPLPQDEPIPGWLKESIGDWINAKTSRPASSLIEFLDSIKSLQECEIPPARYLVPNVLPEGALIMFSGPAGSGKSTLAMKIAYLASAGLPIFGFPQQARRVLYCDRDNPPSLVKDRMKRLRMEPNQRFKYWGGHLGVDIPNSLFSDPGLIEWIEREPIKPIVVIDSQISFQQGKENDSNDIRAFYNPLRQLTNRGVTVIVIHHTGKGESTKEFRGAEDIRAAIDVGYVISNSLKVGLGTLTLNAFKARIIVEEAIALNYRNGEFIPQDLKFAIGEQLRAILKSTPGLIKSQLEDEALALHIPRKDVRQFVDAGVGMGTILTRRGERNAQCLYLPESIEAPTQSQDESNPFNLPVLSNTLN